MAKACVGQIIACETLILRYVEEYSRHEGLVEAESIFPNPLTIQVTS
jgi:hypothetical protein